MGNDEGYICKCMQFCFISGSGVIYVTFRKLLDESAWRDLHIFFTFLKHLVVDR